MKVVILKDKILLDSDIMFVGMAKIQKIPSILVWRQIHQLPPKA